MAVEMDQQLRSRDLEKGTGPIFSSHMVAHIWSQGSTPALDSADTRHAHGVQIYMQAKYQFT